MPYGEIRVDTITFTNGGVDTSITVSGLAASTTGNLTVTGTISGATVRATTVSGVTVTGTTVQGASGTFTSITGGVATITSGVFAAGSAAAPSISFTSDANTGIYSPGADQLAISTNGAGRLFVDASGRVGIGTTGPEYTLDLAPGSAGTTLRVRGGTGGSGIIQFTDYAASAQWGIVTATSSSIDVNHSSVVRLYTANTERMRITSAGLVGIGTSSPSALLHIVSGDAIQIIENSAATSNASLQLKYPSRTWSIANRGADLSGSLTFRDITASADRLVIDSSGRVGIGTTSPATNLDLFATDCKLRVRDIGQTNGLEIYQQNSDGGSRIFAANNNYIAIGTNNTERLRITSAGLVGVGTSAPDRALHIQTPDGTASQIHLGQTARRDFYIGMPAGQPYFDIFDASAGASRLAIDVNGRVGIGTTSPSELLHVAGLARFGANDASTAGINIGEGATGNRFAFVDLVGDTTYTDYGLRIIRLNTGENAPSQIIHRGTGACSLNAVEAAPLIFATSSAERARIDSSGRLLVGTSVGTAVGAVGGHQFVVEGSNGATSSISTIRNDVSASPSVYTFAKSRNNAIVLDGDIVGRIEAAAHDGTDVRTPLGRIEFAVDGTPGVDDMPGRLVFSTTADGASSPTERMRIASNGVITIQNGAVAVIGTLTDGATITPDFAADCNFTVTLGGNRTIANPTNITAGQSGSIFLVQDATGSRTVSWGSFWDFPGGTAPTLSTAANAVDRIDYIVRSSTSIHTVFTANYS